ncbi:thiolase family protein [Caloramator sp. E03]|uniref:thiolase family protein n=1 Tax=Caloramator sp. E03 TaxID=2576307 RepID=UPI00111001E2|nr:thiolase family protein [Caloramator sp. E03]QCX33886.1 thiolase family protein [Caloramator sp. E03]
MEKCVIVAYGRSAIAKAIKGTLAAANPVDFGAEVLKGVVKRVPQLDLNDIDDVIVGCAIPEGKMGLNPARNIVIRAGFPVEVPAQTVNRFCASGVQAVAIGASMIMSGLQDVVIAGGVESMSCPVISDNSAYLNEWLLNNTDIYMPMGITAENVAARCGISRERMEQMAVESHAKAAEAVENGLFDDEIIPVTGYDKEGNPVIFKRDECYRKGTNMEVLATLKPCFKEDGLVTAATSSQRSDGASFVVLMSEKKAKELGIKPIASFISFAVEGLDPAYMGLGPIYAVEKVLDKSGLTLEDMDVIELNEAFASQAIATIDELKMDKSKVNPRGGALALGHPLGATGAILLCKAMNYLKDTGGKYGLITMCVGGGMGAACIIEMME